MTTDYSFLCVNHSKRIAALETQRETDKACILDIYEKLDRLKVQHESNWARIVKLEASANHFPDATKMVSAPTGGLVERVALAISRCEDSTDWGDEVINWSPEARAAILAVADWLDRCKLLYQGGEVPVCWLREEVERG